MSKEVKTFDELMMNCDDPSIVAMGYRYYQHLELGCNHAREEMMEALVNGEMTMEEFYARMPKSKRAMQEAELLQSHSGEDITQIMLRQRYSRCNGD